MTYVFVVCMWFMCVCVCVGQVCGICDFVLCGVCVCVCGVVPFLCRGHNIMKDPIVFLTFDWRSRCPPETSIFWKMYHGVE